MRQRLEDMGRVMVLLEEILNLDIFNENRYGYSESLIQSFKGAPIEKQDGILQSYVSGINILESKIKGVLEIAKGEDELNGS